VFKKNYTKQDLINDVSDNTGFSLNFSKKLVNDLINIIIDNIKKGDFILKNIGSFKIKDKKERIGRNPKTGKEFIISSRRSISFTPSKKITQNLNE
jgi:integration host factor subunit alpha